MDLRIVQNAGDLMLFSTCQLRASARNEIDRIRFSYDLRTLSIEMCATIEDPQTSTARRPDPRSRIFCGSAI